VVTAPATAADVSSPVVTVVSPARNARVSGSVRVVATATDDVGVVRMTIATPSGTVLRAVDGASLTYDWNVAGYKRGSTQTLVVRAWDAAGNVGSAQVVVRIGR
jgi:endo-1,4-beta-xylanase